MGNLNIFCRRVNYRISEISSFCRKSVISINQLKNGPSKIAAHGKHYVRPRSKKKYHINLTQIHKHTVQIGM